MNEKNLLAFPFCILTVCCWLLCAVDVCGQERAPRRMQYWPTDDGAIVCVNGENRYTRALYGGHTLFRLETSDRPVFAIYNKAKSRNVALWLDCGEGKRVKLDSVEWCRSVYDSGRRCYELRDSRWGDGSLRVVALASQKSERALLRVEASGFERDVTLETLVRPVAKWKMSREGDLGLEPRTSYEAKTYSADEKAEETRCEMTLRGGAPQAGVVIVEADSVSVCEGKEAGALIDEELALLDDVTGRLEFRTPNAFINTLGGNLAAAADGIWDGETWLHGAIGWRMPLAGWRGAYVGDVMGWWERQRSHFEAYRRSQVTNVPPVESHPTQDSAKNLARAVERWGTQMYSNGYICRYPNRNNRMHHYDMNLNFVDELLWHFCYDADTTMMRQMLPLLRLHLEWEKRNFDPDGDHLYDAYCCIWASDALYYNGGAVTHSSAYNYRGNLLTARICEMLGEDGSAYRAEAEAILRAMNNRLWIDDEGHWAEFQDAMGEKRLHKSAALWSIYTPIDCGACSPEQAYRATEWVDRAIPHIPVRIGADKEEETGSDSQADRRRMEAAIPDALATLSTTNWLPYDWSTNNVAHEEVMNMVLAYFKAGRNESGYRLLMADLLDGQYLGACPGNFGQISYYDKARNEAYRDFGDCVGISARAIVNGLFGVQPDALYGRLVLQPGFPADWDSVTFRSPYLEYHYRRGADGHVTMDVEQHFPQALQVVVRLSDGHGKWTEMAGSRATRQRIELRVPTSVGSTSISTSVAKDLTAAYGTSDVAAGSTFTPVDISRHFNSNVDDIFKNEYLSPRSPYTTLEIPKQGIGQWCVPDRTAHIEDDGLRHCIVDGLFDTGLQGLAFRSPSDGHNIAYTSLWDNYPDSLVIPLKGKADYACLLMAGSTNNMQSRIDNGIVVATYKDGSTDTLRLENPRNWCPIEQEYYIDGLAFHTDVARPYRVHLASGRVARELAPIPEVGKSTAKGFSLGVKGNPDSAEPLYIDGGAAQILRMPLKGRKPLKSLTLRTLSNDVVVGLMAVTLERCAKASAKGK